MSDTLGLFPLSTSEMLICKRTEQEASAGDNAPAFSWWSVTIYLEPGR